MIDLRLIKIEEKFEYKHGTKFNNYAIKTKTHLIKEEELERLQIIVSLIQLQMVNV